MAQDIAQVGMNLLRFERYGALPAMSAGRAIRRRLPGRWAPLRRAQNRTSGAYTFRRRVVTGRDAQRGWSGENRRRASRPGLRRAELAGYALDSWEIPLLKYVILVVLYHVCYSIFIRGVLGV